MASKAKHRWLTWLLLGVALLVFARMARTAELSQVLALFKARGPILALSVLPYLLVLWFDAAGWGSLLSTLGRRVGAREVFWVRTSTEALHRSLPGGAVAAEAIKPYLLRKRARVPIAETTASLAMSKVLTIATQSLYIAVASLVAFHLIGANIFTWLSLGSALMLALLSLLAALVMGHGAVAERLYRVIHRIPVARLRNWLEEKERSFLETDQHSTELFRAQKRRLAVSALWLLGAWACESLDSWISLRLLGVSASYVNVLCFESLVSLIRSLAFFLPGALGVQDLSYMTFLKTFHVADDANVLMAFVILKRAKEVFWIATGFVGLLMLQRSRRSPPELIEASQRGNSPKWSFGVCDGDSTERR